MYTIIVVLEEEIMHDKNCMEVETKIVNILEANHINVARLNRQQWNTVTDVVEEFGSKMSVQHSTRNELYFNYDDKIVFIGARGARRVFVLTQL